MMRLIEVNVSFSIVCDVTHSMHSHDSFSVLVVASYPCTKISKQEKYVVSWNVVNCHLLYVVKIILVLFICVLNGGVGYDNGEFDVPCIQLGVGVLAGNDECESLLAFIVLSP